MKTRGYEWQDRTVLVTGASGFKGSWLSAVLRRLGARVHGTTRERADPSSAYQIIELDREIIAANVDVSNQQQVYDLLSSIAPDVIFHLAAQSLVSVSMSDPRRTFEINVGGTMNLLEACCKLRLCDRLLVCSSDHVFGNVAPDEIPDRGFDERTRVSYGLPYDTSKAAMELVVRSYHYSYWGDLPAIGITRCANVFGFGDTNQGRVVPAFVRAAVEGRPISPRYGLIGRQFIHVGDAVAGYVLAAASLGDCGRNHDLGERPGERSPFTPTHHFAIEEYPETDQPYIRIGDLAELVARAFDGRVDDSECVDYPPDENRVQALNCRRTRESLQWSARRTLVESLEQLGEWYRAGDDRALLRRLIHDELAVVVQALSGA